MAREAWFPALSSFSTHPNSSGTSSCPTSGQRLEGCITVRQEVKRINRKDQLSIVIHHDDFKEADKETFQELYAVKKHFTLQAEGDPDFFFNLPVAANVQEEPQELLLPPVVDDQLMGENHR